MSLSPVAGVDVSKRFSDMCILTSENKVFMRIKIYHDLTSMSLAQKSLEKAELKLGAKPVIVMESTSHYHLILFQFLTDSGYDVIVVNPLQSSALRNFNVRKIKNDKVDAYKLALLYRTNVLKRSQIPTAALRSLRMLCRQHREIKEDITRYKNRLTALLDQVFPGYSKVFCDIAAVGSLAVLERYPTPELMLTSDVNELSGIIQNASNKGKEYGHKKVELLHEIAVEASHIGIHAPGDQVLMSSVIIILKQLLACTAEIDRQIQSLIKQNAYMKESCELLQTIPGMGKHSAAVILSEIGDFTLFRKPKQLAAYFGLDPSENKSGTYQGSNNKLSKRGSSYARAALYMVAHNTVHVNRFGTVSNPVLAEFYQKKRQTKPPNVAICAVMHKLSNIIFAVLRDEKPFEMRQPEEHNKKLNQRAAA